MQRNFDYLEARLDGQDEMTVADLAVLLEDAIDIHDRHWKIHWMLNFAQLSATLNLRAVMEKTHGKVDDALLGRLQNSANDRNWDSIRAVGDERRGQGWRRTVRRLRARVGGGSPRDAAASERGRRFIAERIEPYQKEFGWHAVWSHEFIFPTVYEKPEPVVELVRGYLQTDYDYPATMGALRDDIAAASQESSPA